MVAKKLAGKLLILKLLEQFVLKCASNLGLGHRASLHSRVYLVSDSWAYTHWLPTFSCDYAHFRAVFKLHPDSCTQLCFSYIWLKRWRTYPRAPGPSFTQAAVKIGLQCIERTWLFFLNPCARSIITPLTHATEACLVQQALFFCLIQPVPHSGSGTGR